jgi:hypothetical protein
MEAFDPGVPFADPAAADLERTMIARAFASLPQRWQAVLWHTEIEGARPAEVATLLGLTANGVAALACRAREGLRQACGAARRHDAVPAARGAFVPARRRAFVPAAAPAPGSQLTTQVNPVGALPPGGTGIVGFSVTNSGPAPVLQVTANVALPLGVSLMAAGAAPAISVGQYPLHPVSTAIL